jgi:hypothetical protein
VRLSAAPLRYVEISDEQWVHNISGAGVNPTAVEHLVHLWRYLRTRPPEYQANYAVTETIGTLGSTKPTTLKEFLLQQKETTFAGLADSAQRESA